MKQSVRHPAVKPPRDRRRGQSVIETALMAPWILILFMAIVDFGLYFYAVIAMQNATRVAALASSSSENYAADAPFACRHVANELTALPNIGSYTGNCTAAPLVVSATRVPAEQSVDGEPASRIRVTYQSVPLFPIPGVAGRLDITREVEMRIEP